MNQGETVGIVGESGSGKSITMLSVMRLIPSPSGQIVAGEVRFEDRDLLKLSDPEMRAIRGNQISMIFQDPMTSLNPVLRIEKQLTEALRLHLGLSQTAARARALELLERVGIPAAAQRLRNFPHQFSGGMRQRVMIAMGLACSPKLMIADEPTTVLDVTIQAQIVELQSLQQEFGLTYLFVAHDLSVVRHLSDRIAVMYLGQIVELADRTTLYENPQHPYTQALLSAIPIPDPTVEAKRQRIVLKGDLPSPTDPPTGCRFHTRCPIAAEICRQTPGPAFREIRPGHSVACHLAESI